MAERAVLVPADTSDEVLAAMNTYLQAWVRKVARDEVRRLPAPAKIVPGLTVRCQFCGSVENVQVHTLVGYEDQAPITTCADCREQPPF